MSAEIFELTPVPLSVLIQESTSLGRARSTDDIIDAIERLRGQVPAADLILAAWRQTLPLVLSHSDEEGLIAALDAMLYEHDRASS